MPSGREQFQALKPSNTNSSSSSLEVLRIPDLPCIVSWEDPRSDHSDPPKVLWSESVPTMPTIHAILVIFCPHPATFQFSHMLPQTTRQPATCSDLIPKTHAPVFFWYLSKNKIPLSLRRSNTIVSKELFLRLHESRIRLIASTIRLLSVECMTLRQIVKLYQHHCSMWVRLSGDNIVKTWGSMTMATWFVNSYHFEAVRIVPETLQTFWDAEALSAAPESVKCSQWYDSKDTVAPPSERPLRGGKNPAVLAVMRSQLHAFHGSGWVSKSHVFQLENVFQLGMIAGKCGIQSSEIRYHDFHVMCNWNFLVHLSAASLAVPSKCFTAAVRCCNASKSGCIGIRATRLLIFTLPGDLAWVTRPDPGTSPNSATACAEQSSSEAGIPNVPPRQKPSGTYYFIQQLHLHAQSTKEQSNLRNSKLAPCLYACLRLTQLWSSRLRPWQTTALQDRPISGEATCPETAASLALRCKFHQILVFAHFGLMPPTRSVQRVQYWTMPSNVHQSCKTLICTAWALLTMVTSKPPCRYHKSGNVSNSKPLCKGFCSNRQA